MGTSIFKEFIHRSRSINFINNSTGRVQNLPLLFTGANHQMLKSSICMQRVYNFTLISCSFHFDSVKNKWKIRFPDCTIVTLWLRLRDLKQSIISSLVVAVPVTLPNLTGNEPCNLNEEVTFMISNTVIKWCNIWKLNTIPEVHTVSRCIKFEVIFVDGGGSSTGNPCIRRLSACEKKA